MILFVISVVIISEIIIFFIRKKHNITLKEYLLRRSVVRHQIRINIIIYAVFIAITIIIFQGVFNSIEWTIIVMLGGFMIFSLFDSFMEYKYKRDEKLYIVRAIPALSIFVILIGAVWLQPPVITFAQYAKESYSHNFEEIREVEVYRGGNPGQDMSLTDEKAIDQLIEKLTDVKMERTLDKTTYEDPFYNLMLKYEYPGKDHEPFSIEVHKDLLIFNHNNQSYKVVNNNDIYELIEQKFD